MSIIDFFNYILCHYGLSKQIQIDPNGVEETISTSEEALKLLKPQKGFRDSTTEQERLPVHEKGSTGVKKMKDSFQENVVGGVFDFLDNHNDHKNRI